MSVDKLMEAVYQAGIKENNKEIRKLLGELSKPTRPPKE